MQDLGTVVCGRSECNCCWAAGDGRSPAAAAAGVPTLAEPGTPLTEGARLALVVCG